MSKTGGFKNILLSFFVYIDYFIEQIKNDYSKLKAFANSSQNREL